VSADICPKCDEQSVRRERCGRCGWSAFDESDVRALSDECDELRAELAALKARIKKGQYVYQRHMENVWLQLKHAPKRRNDIKGRGPWKSKALLIDFELFEAAP
jgi:hypothetical protein